MRAMSKAWLCHSAIKWEEVIELHRLACKSGTFGERKKTERLTDADELNFCRDRGFQISAPAATSITCCERSLQRNLLELRLETDTFFFGLLCF